MRRFFHKLCALHVYMNSHKLELIKSAYEGIHKIICLSDVKHLHLDERPKCVEMCLFCKIFIFKNIMDHSQIASKICSEYYNITSISLWSPVVNMSTIINSRVYARLRLFKPDITS